jgi:hypothetical protein
MTIEGNTDGRSIGAVEVLEFLEAILNSAWSGGYFSTGMGKNILK